MNDNKTILFAMPNTGKLGKKVAEKLSLDIAPMKVTRFADGEAILESKMVVRNKNVFIIASTCIPVNTNLMELLIFIDSLKRASAKSINIIMTYYGYARQDRKIKGKREPITSKLVANLLQIAGASSITIIDAHNPSIQGFFDIPVDDLHSSYIFGPILSKMGSFTVVSPDHGGIVRARELASILVKEESQPSIAIIVKKRVGVNKVETFGILGNVKDKNCVIIDDLIDTGGTILKACKALKEAGAKKIGIAATHGLFSRGFEQFEKLDSVDFVLITDSVERVHEIKSNKLKILSLTDYIAGVINSYINSTSVCMLYKKLVDKVEKK